MIRITSKLTWIVAAVAALVAAAPAPVYAQVTPNAAAQSSASAPRVPSLTVSVGSGLLVPYRDPEMRATDILGSVKFPLARFLAAEGEVTRSTGREGVFTGRDDRLDRPFVPVWTIREVRDGLTVAGNLLFHTGGPRVSAFAGGGLGVHRTTGSMVTASNCIPRVTGACESRPDTQTEQRFVTTGLRRQLVGGLDVRLAPRLAVFGEARWRTEPDAGLGFIGGVRVDVRSRPVSARRASQPPPNPQNPVSPAEGMAVRVTSLNGDRRTGTLVSLSASEVVFRERGRDVTVPLAEVRKVEKITHYARMGALIGAGGGFVIGYLGSCGGGDEEDCWPEVGALVAGIGAGAGAAIGAGTNRSNAPKHTLYSAPTRSPSVHVIPVMTPKKAGVAVAMQW